jgi:hypothetical protein
LLVTEYLADALNKKLEHFEAPLNFVLLAEHLKNDPDENFTGVSFRVYGIIILL